MTCTTPTGTQTGSFSSCEPFTITTSDSTFTLLAQVQPSPSSTATTVTIVVPTTVAMESEKLAGLLGVSKFPHEQHVHAERRIHPTFYGDYHGNQLQHRNHCPSSSSSSTFSASLSSTFPASLSSTFPASLLCLHVPRAPPCPAYACPPRPACCLTRLFARRSHRNSCW